MTLLSMVTTASHNVGADFVGQVVGSADETSIEWLDFANRLGQELARRVEWGELTKATTLAGSAASFTMPADFERFISGIAITRQDRTPIRPLTQAEWRGLDTSLTGDPRYFLLQGSEVSLYPLQPATDACTASYISNLWVSTGATSAAAFTADDNTVVFPEELFESGLILYWRRQKGMPYEDFEAEFEAQIGQYAAFDDRARF